MLFTADQNCSFLFQSNDKSTLNPQIIHMSSSGGFNRRSCGQYTLETAFSPSLCSFHGSSSSFSPLFSLQPFISLPSFTLHLPVFVSQELPGIHLKEVLFPNLIAPHQLSADPLRLHIQLQPIIFRPSLIPESVPGDWKVIVP